TPPAHQAHPARPPPAAPGDRAGALAGGQGLAPGARVRRPRGPGVLHLLLRLCLRRRRLDDGRLPALRHYAGLVARNRWTSRISAAKPRAEPLNGSTVTLPLVLDQRPTTRPARVAAGPIMPPAKTRPWCSPPTSAVFSFQPTSRSSHSGS